MLQVTEAQEVTKENNPQIYEMVEELCIAADIPLPKVYISPTDEVNAFATGFSPQSASLVLYQGLIDIMSKREVQGVIGHELSHIRNYDTRVTVLASILSNLIFWSGVGSILIGWTMLNSKGKGWLALAWKVGGLLVLAFGAIVSVIAIPISKLLVLLISRQREYLADAGSVDLTREPSGLISGLEKLEKLEENIPLESKQKDKMVLNSLYFNGHHLSKWYDSLFSDHPPLEKESSVCRIVQI